MAGPVFNQVRAPLPLLFALVLTIGVGCGAAEQATQAPAAQPTQAPVAQPTEVPAPTAQAVAGTKSGGHIRMSAYADTKDWDPKGSSSLSSVQAYSQL